MFVPWAVFIGFVLLLLAIDLGVFHRSAHAVGFREALIWSAVWLVLGVGFAGVVFTAYESKTWGLGKTVDPVDGLVNDGAAAAEKYLTGYLVEKSLSVDNIFVMSIIFSSLAVPAIYQHRVLFWGVSGALAMRAAMIVVGAKLIHDFHWLLYVFAAFLLVTGLKMLWAREGTWDPRTSPLFRWCRGLMPLTDDYHGQRFIVRSPTGGRRTAWAFTPLALALLLVEGADLVFAIDSIPAIFAITGDPFLVFTSNVFAMLGLRSLYFALAGLVGRFHYLKPALALVLLLVATKMLCAEWLKDMLGPRFNLAVLGAVAAIIASGVVASIVADVRGRQRTPAAAWNP